MILDVHAQKGGNVRIGEAPKDGADRAKRQGAIDDGAGSGSQPERSWLKRFKLMRPLEYALSLGEQPPPGGSQDRLSFAAIKQLETGRRLQTSNQVADRRGHPVHLGGSGEAAGPNGRLSASS